MNPSVNDEASASAVDQPTGIAPSNIFLGLLPLPYSLSTLKSSLLLSRTPTSSSASSADTSISQTPANNKNNTTHPSSSPSRAHSPAVVDSKPIEKQSPVMSASTYRSSAFSMSKPPLYTQAREKERFELSTLNDKFADYVEKVRYLEAQNKKVEMDVTHLTQKEQESCQKVKSKFESEIAQLRQTAEQMFKDKNSAFGTAQETQNSILPLKQHLNQTFRQRDSSKYDTEKVERQLSSVEGDILMYKRRLAHQENEHTQWKALTAHLQRLLVQTSNEIQSESLVRTASGQKTQQLQADIVRLREQHQQKVKDLKRSALVAGSNSTNDRAHVFKSELSSAIRHVRQDFERENDTHRNELYAQFTQSYDSIIRQHPELAHLFLSDREQERIRQEEDRVRLDIQRVRADINALKQKTAELKLHIREVQIKMEMATDENQRFEQLQQNEISQLQSQHERTSQDYEDVISKQTSLEQEIETYRNLLEGTMKPVVDHITDEYNTIAANQTKAERLNETSEQKGYTSNVDRTSTKPLYKRTNDNNFYGAFQNLYSYGKSSDTFSPNVVNIPITRFSEESSLDTKLNDNEQHIVEIDETTNDSSSYNA